MYVVLLWNPGAATDDFEERTPFDGVEVGLLTSNRREAEEYVSEMGDVHPDWHFCLIPMTASN